jgi:hypothetical protein
MIAAIDMTGARVGRWTVESLVPGSSPRRWLCRCDCGSEKELSGTMLRAGVSQSCGCLRTELLTKHGRNRKPGGVRDRSPAYVRWSAMLQRCENQNNRAYVNYGGRGIAVCDQWHDFRAFLADMGEPPVNSTLDRIDNDRGYEPGNCRWASRKDQQRNRRNNRVITLDGEARCLTDWAEARGLNVSTVRYRLRAGQSPAVALTRG